LRKPLKWRFSGMKIELSKKHTKGKVETQSQSQSHLGQIVVKAKSSIGPKNEVEKCQIDDLLKKSGLLGKYFWEN
jgi:hypothetical protein